MSSGITCSIALTQSSKIFYWTGETITGDVVLTVERPIKLKSISIKVFGQLVYSVTTSSGKGPAITRTVREEFYSEKQLLFIPEIDGISYDQDGYYFESNIYRFPFSMRLAESLPPSLFSLNGRIPHIDYFLEVNLVRSEFHRNIREKVFILVTPRVHPPQHVRFIDYVKENFRDLYIHGRLLRNYVLIGDHYIDLGLNIHNPSQTTINEIIVKLVQHRRFGHRHDLVVLLEEVLSDIKSFHNDELHETFQIPVPLSPSLFAPSSVYSSTKKKSSPWIVDYELEVKFKTKLFFTDITLKFPLIVANSNDSSYTLA